MKRLIFFDLDNTIYSAKDKKVLPQTLKLLKKLSKEPKTILGLATGRAPSNVKMIEDILPMFKYKVFINGALVYEDNTLIYENSISNEIIENIYNKSKEIPTMIGLVSKENEYVLNINETINTLDMNKRKKIIPFELKYLKDDSIYQIWVFTQNPVEVDVLIKDSPLNHYSWHKGGYDIVDNQTNKANAIKKIIKDKEKNCQLIAVGDGENDIGMIEIADIGIAMDNSRFERLKEKADHIAPTIEADQLYDFFESIKLIF